MTLPLPNFACATYGWPLPMTMPKTTPRVVHHDRPRCATYPPCCPCRLGIHDLVLEFPESQGNSCQRCIESRQLMKPLDGITGRDPRPLPPPTTRRRAMPIAGETDLGRRLQRCRMLITPQVAQDDPIGLDLANLQPLRALGLFPGFGTGRYAVTSKPYFLACQRIKHGDRFLAVGGLIEIEVDRTSCLSACPRPPTSAPRGKLDLGGVLRPSNW